MKKTTAAFLALVASAAMAGGAQAQICASFPTVDRQFSFEANLLTTEGVDLGDVWGVGASYNASGPLAVFGGMTVAEGGTEDTETFTGGVAFELPSVASMIGTGVSACPVVSLSFADIGIGDVFLIPVGFGVGTNLSSGSGFSISPYVIPQVIFGRFNASDDAGGLVEDESDTQFGISGGVVLGFGTFFVGGTIGHVFEDESDPTFGIRAGIRL